MILLKEIEGCEWDTCDRVFSIPYKHHAIPFETCIYHLLACLGQAVELAAVKSALSILVESNFAGDGITCQVPATKKDNTLSCLHL